MIKKLKNIEMVKSVNSLMAFVNKDKIVPVALSTAISANIKSLTRELEPYEEERKKIAASNSEDGQERFEELCNLEVDVPIRTVTSEIIRELELSTKDYMALEFMIAGD